MMPPKQSVDLYIMLMMLRQGGSMVVSTDPQEIALARSERRAWTDRDSVTYVYYPRSPSNLRKPA